MLLEVFEVRADEVQLGVLFVIVRELSVVISGVIMVERLVAIRLVKVLRQFAGLAWLFSSEGRPAAG